ncbi:MAG: zinc ABC transporter substrate-binding protein [Bacteroides sp.]|nr:zinc ABC transporter substrate-binding protein [Bacteroides sp.]
MRCLLASLLIVIVTTLFGCHSNSRQNTLTVSIEPQRFLLEQIVGDKWDVVTLLGNGDDPENFDPTMANFRDLADSRAYFTVGTINFESTVANRMGSDLHIVDTGEGVNRLYGTHLHHHDHEGHADAPEEMDPHIWVSMGGLKRMSNNMLGAMIEIDPANALFYKANHARLVAYLDSCTAVIDRNLEQSAGKAFMVWHPTLSYFAREHSLEQLPIGMENKEMSVASFRHNIEDARSHGVSVFFVEPGFDSGKSASIASEAGITSSEINTMIQNLPAELIRISKVLASNNNH